MLEHLFLAHRTYQELLNRTEVDQDLMPQQTAALRRMSPAFYNDINTAFKIYDPKKVDMLSDFYDKYFDARGYQYRTQIDPEWQAGLTQRKVLQMIDEYGDLANASHKKLTELLGDYTPVLTPTKGRRAKMSSSYQDRPDLAFEATGEHIGADSANSSFVSQSSASSWRSSESKMSKSPVESSRRSITPQHPTVHQDEKFKDVHTNRAPGGLIERFGTSFFGPLA
jgi:hypothetical protein